MTAASRAEARVRGCARTSAVARIHRAAAEPQPAQPKRATQAAALAVRVATARPWHDGATCLECVAMRDLYRRPPRLCRWHAELRERG